MPIELRFITGRRVQSNYHHDFGNPVRGDELGNVNPAVTIRRMPCNVNRQSITSNEFGHSCIVANRCDAVNDKLRSPPLYPLHSAAEGGNLPLMAELLNSTCTLEEAVEICQISGRSLWRWRGDRLFTVTADWEGRTPTERAKLLARRQSPAWGVRLDTEDLTRLLVISHLGSMGMDRHKLVDEALGHPWAIDIVPGREPGWLLIYQQSGTGKLTREAVDTVAEVTKMLQQTPTAYVADLKAFRGAARRAIAALDAKTDRKQKNRRTA